MVDERAFGPTSWGNEKNHVRDAQTKTHPDAARGARRPEPGGDASGPLEHGARRPAGRLHDGHGPPRPDPVDPRRTKTAPTGDVQSTVDQIIATNHLAVGQPPPRPNAPNPEIRPRHESPLTPPEAHRAAPHPGSLARPQERPHRNRLRPRRRFHIPKPRGRPTAPRGQAVNVLSATVPHAPRAHSAPTATARAAASPRAARISGHVPQPPQEGRGGGMCFRRYSRSRGGPEGRERRSGSDRSAGCAQGACRRKHIPPPRPEPHPKSSRGKKKRPRRSGAALVHSP